MHTNITGYIFKCLDNTLYPIDLSDNNYYPKPDFKKRECSLLGLTAKVIIDAISQPLRPLLHAIERVALSAINLVGALFTHKCTLKEALYQAEAACNNIISVPFTTIKTALNVIPHLIQTLSEPDRVFSLKEIRDIYNFQSNWAV